MSWIFCGEINSTYSQYIPMLCFNRFVPCSLYMSTLSPKCFLLCSVNFFFYVPCFAGEALLVTSGLVLYFGDMLACTISKVRAALSHPIQAVMTEKSSRISILMLTTLFEQVCRLLISPELVSIRYGIKRSEIGIIIQV